MRGSRGVDNPGVRTRRLFLRKKWFAADSSPSALADNIYYLYKAPFASHDGVQVVERDQCFFFGVGSLCIDSVTVSRRYEDGIDGRRGAGG